MQPTQQQTYTADEVQQLEAQASLAGRQFELIGGELHEKMSASFLSSHIALNIGRHLLNYLDDHPLGYLTGADGAYRLSDTLRLIPDVGYITKARMPQPSSGEVPLGPDLAVEVISPSDSIQATRQKAALYLKHDTQLVWVVHPTPRLVEVYRPGMDVQLLSGEDMLSGGDLLPNFTLPLPKLFAV